MKIAVLGTGMVGRSHAAKLTELGYDVIMGTRVVAKTEARNQPDEMGNESFAEWHAKNSAVKLATFKDAAEAGDLIIDAIAGEASYDVIKKLKSEIGDKIIIDISNPLDFSKGMPPTLSVSNDDSLGEEIQKVLPKAKVVKTLNTMNYSLQVNPRMMADGVHNVLISGNDEAAKQTVTDILKKYGWREIIDLGDITTARGAEMFLPLWLQLMGKLGSPMFNIRIVK